MTYRFDDKVFRCIELSTHEITESITHYIGHSYHKRRFCNQHTIQLKMSNDFKGKKFNKL